MSFGDSIDLVMFSIENESIPSHLLVSREIEELAKMTPKSYDFSYETKLIAQYTKLKREMTMRKERERLELQQQQEEEEEKEAQRKQSTSIPVSTVKTTAAQQPLSRQQKLEHVGAQIGADQAEFYLDMSGWDVDTAVALYRNLTS